MDYSSSHPVTLQAHDRQQDPTATACAATMFHCVGVCRSWHKLMPFEWEQRLENLQHHRHTFMCLESHHRQPQIMPTVATHSSSTSSGGSSAQLARDVVAEYWQASNYARKMELQAYYRFEEEEAAEPADFPDLNVQALLYQRRGQIRNDNDEIKRQAGTEWQFFIRLSTRWFECDSTMEEQQQVQDEAESMGNLLLWQGFVAPFHEDEAEQYSCTSGLPPMRSQRFLLTPVAKYLGEAIAKALADGNGLEGLQELLQERMENLAVTVVAKPYYHDAAAAAAAAERTATNGNNYTLVLATMGLSSDDEFFESFQTSMLFRMQHRPEYANVSRMALNVEAHWSIHLPSSSLLLHVCYFEWPELGDDYYYFYGIEDDAAEGLAEDYLSNQRPARRPTPQRRFWSRPTRQAPRRRRHRNRMY